MTAPALQARALKVRLGDRQVLGGLSLALPAGRWTAIVGPNGAGKSTTFNLITGVLRSTFVVDPDGTISSAQYNVKATGHVDRLRKQIGV